mmetsp:Transcript_13657/g.43641  ORF Transcript_13657/g.43641 Transcript_13657/m.43641 type:complete len:232 (-) Transcript_13657:405-1100(-)
MANLPPKGSHAQRRPAAPATAAGSGIVHRRGAREGARRRSSPTASPLGMRRHATPMLRPRCDTTARWAPLASNDSEFGIACSGTDAMRAHDRVLHTPSSPAAVMATRVPPAGLHRSSSAGASPGVESVTLSPPLGSHTRTQDSADEADARCAPQGDQSRHVTGACGGTCRNVIHARGDLVHPSMFHTQSPLRQPSASDMEAEGAKARHATSRWNSWSKRNASGLREPVDGS